MKEHVISGGDPLYGSWTVSARLTHSGDWVVIEYSPIALNFCEFMDRFKERAPAVALAERIATRLRAQYPKRVTVAQD